MMGSATGRPTRGEARPDFGGSILGSGMIDFEEAKRILAAFEREGVEYVMVGSRAKSCCSTESGFASPPPRCSTA
jgi:hypothetical protein